MKALTKAEVLANCEERVARAHRAGYEQGENAASAKLAQQFSQMKLAQMTAAVGLLEQAGRLMSRAGYMIGKINGDNSR